MSGNDSARILKGVTVTPKLPTIATRISVETLTPPTMTGALVADTLREKLQALVEETRVLAGRCSNLDAGFAYSSTAQKLAILLDLEPQFGAGTTSAFGGAPGVGTILAESEEPKPKPLITPTGGVVLVPNPGQTHYVGDDCPGGHAEVGEMLPVAKR